MLHTERRWSVCAHRRLVIPAAGETPAPCTRPNLRISRNAPPTSVCRDAVARGREALATMNDAKELSSAPEVRTLASPMPDGATPEQIDRTSAPESSFARPVGGQTGLFTPRRVRSSRLIDPSYGGPDGKKVKSSSGTRTRRHQLAINSVPHTVPVHVPPEVLQTLPKRSEDRSSPRRQVIILMSIQTSSQISSKPLAQVK